MSLGPKSSTTVTRTRILTLALSNSPHRFSFLQAPPKTAGLTSRTTRTLQNEANLQQECGCINSIVDVHPPHSGLSEKYNYIRTWYFQSNAIEREGANPSPRWEARLQIPANLIAFLSSFKLDETMTPAQICGSMGWNHLREAGYIFSAAPNVDHGKDATINCIYDDMPLRGWRPWPRVDAGEPPEDEKKENGVV
ncbi:hypothetical protein B0H66DRAFT_607806 [Apodospora peruviana]|uniref:Uncharacterized protein n=1 Tax=Apodospora peruviana TaxID=516989 RepID=A0AAE0HUC1_9PEZI|nr:hypothetical protein B0H66DRAFT_607806 [Apodospora peruviana]